MVSRGVRRCPEGFLRCPKVSEVVQRFPKVPEGVPRCTKVSVPRCLKVKVSLDVRR
jgi:hypothetical protein